MGLFPPFEAAGETDANSGWEADRPVPAQAQSLPAV